MKNQQHRRFKGLMKERPAFKALYELVEQERLEM
jgi:hypothetical protein